MTPSTAMLIVTYAYLATFLCVAIMELRPRGRLAHVAALASMILVTAGGAAWSYAALYQKSQWPEFAVPQRQAANDNSSQARHNGRRGQEMDTDAEGDAEEQG